MSKTLTRVITLCTLCALVATGCKSNAPEPASAEQTTDAAGLNGYDPVAYQTTGEATQGSAQITTEHDGTTYRFVDAVSRDAFTAEPARYVPALKGFCVVCKTAKNRDVAGDPTVFSVYEDRLFLFPNAGVKKTFDEDPGTYAQLAR